MRDVKPENLGIAKSVKFQGGDYDYGRKGTVNEIERGLKRCKQRLSRLNHPRV